MAEFNLTDLEKIVAQRAGVDDGSSYTAMLVRTGIEKCAQKMGEEAVETVIAAVNRNTEELTKEAADLLFHLMVVLNKSDIALSQVMEELEKRTSQSGLEEKKSRGKQD